MEKNQRQKWVREASGIIEKGALWIQAVAARRLRAALALDDAARRRMIGIEAKTIDSHLIGSLCLLSPELSSEGSTKRLPYRAGQPCSCLAR
jgi:hypothetical protein